MSTDVTTAGAKGDGHTDDTAAIQAALDRGGVVHLPTGDYRVTAPLVLRGTLNGPAAIRGEVCSPGGGGASILFDGPPGTPCVLELAGGFGVSVERLRIDCRGKAQFGVYLHDDLPRAPMSDVTLRDVAVGSPLPGDSPAMPKGGRSAAFSIGLRTDGTLHTGQCDSIKLIGCQAASTGDAHAAHYAVAIGTANVKNVFLEHPWICGFGVALYLPAGSGTCTVTGGAGLSMTVADFLVGSGILAVTGWESEGSARLLTTSGWQSSYASASFERCAWYGSPADDVAVAFCGSLSLRGCDLRAGRTPTSVPKVQVMASQAGGVTGLISEQCFYQHATAKSSPFPIVGPWVRSFGDIGGTAGALVALPCLPAPPAAPPAPDPAPPGVVKLGAAAIKYDAATSTFFAVWPGGHSKAIINP